MKKFNKNLIVAIPLFLILFNTEPSYCEELDQNDLQYQFKVLPMIIAATNHFNEVSARIRELIGNPNVDLAIELCNDSKTSYKTIGTLGKNIASVKPGRVYFKYSKLLSQLFALRKAMLLLLMQSCASDPLFEKPSVWDSFKIRSIQLEEQISQVSSELEEELNNIDKSFQDGQ
jgi:hypothetical protein